MSKLDRIGRTVRGLIDLKHRVKDKDKDNKDDIISNTVCYNVEDYVLGNEIIFEKICMGTGMEKGKAKKELRKYHLWLEKNEKYPMGKKAAAAGFESWLLNENNFNNGKSTTSTVGKSIKFDRP